MIQKCRDLRTKLGATAFFLEALLMLVTVLVIFWFLRQYDVFEVLVRVSREYEEWELDEFFIFIMLATFFLCFIVFRNTFYLKKEIRRRMQVEAEIKKLVFYDGLTGLPNRDLCHSRLAEKLLAAQQHCHSLAVLFVDLDNFKGVNDSYGHACGDLLLKESSLRLSRQLGAADTLARIAGDEFVIIVASGGDKDAVAMLAKKLITALSAPFDVCGHAVCVGASIGAALFPQHGRSPEALLRNSDIAMYQAKREGKNTVRFFSEALEVAAVKKLEMSTQLRQALTKNEFSLNYQPVFDVDSGKIRAVEALLRWDNEIVGRIGSECFIAAAEGLGLIEDIDNWVVRQACEQNKLWQEAGYPPVVMSVNLSAAQLSNLDYVDNVKHCIEDVPLAPQYLELEITETALMQDIDSAVQCLNGLKNFGVSVAIDDFGTGYSSLSYLRKLDVNRLKIDKSFLRNIPNGAEDMITARAIIALAVNLNLNVTAEGIETEAQLEFIRNTACDSVQGYYFGGPVSAADFEALLAKQINLSAD